MPPKQAKGKRKAEGSGNAGDTARKRASKSTGGMQAQSGERQPTPAGPTTAWGPAGPPEQLRPGVLGDPKSFLDIEDKNDRVGEELKLAGYLGLPSIQALRYFAVCWPVLECLRTVIHHVLQHNKRMTLDVYMKNKELIEYMATMSPAFVNEKWPLQGNDLVRLETHKHLWTARAIFRMQQKVLFEYNNGHPAALVRSNGHERYLFERDLGIKLPQWDCLWPPRLRTAYPHETDVEAFNRCLEVIKYISRTLESTQLWASRLPMTTGATFPNAPPQKPGWMQTPDNCIVRFGLYVQPDLEQ